MTELLHSILDLPNRMPHAGSEVYVEPLRNLDRLFMTEHYGAQWEQFKREFLGKDVFYCLKVLDHKFWELKLSEPVVPADYLSDLKKQVQDLFEEVKASDLEIPLRQYVLKLLDAIRKGVAMYDIYGTEGLNDHLATIIGQMQVRSLKAKPKDDAKKAGGLLLKVQKVFTAYAIVVAMANPVVEQTHKLVENVRNCVEDGSKLVGDFQQLAKEHGIVLPHEDENLNDNEAEEEDDTIIDVEAERLDEPAVENVT